MGRFKHSIRATVAGVAAARIKRFTLVLDVLSGI